MTTAKINSQGRLVIPAECREAAGLKPGEELQIEVVGEGEVRLMTKRRAIRRVQEIYLRHADPKRDPVQELIEERRREAARTRNDRRR